MSVVNCEINAAIATVTMNRPGALNALDYELAVALSQTLTGLAGDAGVRCVVLAGEGGHFMAGGDIAYFAEKLQQGEGVAERVGPLFDHVHGIIRTLQTMPQPVIAKVRGACAGFGVSLMSACDLAVVDENSVFTLAYCHLGVSPDGGSTWSLPRTLGHKRAAELVFLGDRFGADRAEQIGLVNRVVDAESLDGEVSKLATRLSRGPARAYARAKALLHQSMQTPLDAQLDDERDAFLACAQEPHFAEGVAAFLEKRPPDFG